jgi:hypothetical protein
VRCKKIELYNAYEAPLRIDEVGGKQVNVRVQSVQIVRVEAIVSIHRNKKIIKDAVQWCGVVWCMVWCVLGCGVCVAGHRVLRAVRFSLPDSMAFRASTACTLRAEGDRTSWRSRAIQWERERERGEGAESERRDMV